LTVAIFPKPVVMPTPSDLSGCGGGTDAARDLTGGEEGGLPIDAPPRRTAAAVIRMWRRSYLDT